MRLNRCLRLALVLCVLGGLTPAARATAGENPPAPYATGTHRQLVRKFYTTADGLPENEIQEVAVTPSGTVLVLAGGAVVRKDDDRWVREAAISGVTGIAAGTLTPALSQGEREKEGDNAIEAFAGAPDGVWTLAGEGWQREESSPDGVTHFAKESDGTLWAMNKVGVWRRAGGWTMVHRLHPEMGPARAICALSPEDCYVAAEHGLYALMGKRRYWLWMEFGPRRLMSNDVRALGRLDAHHFIAATDRGFNLTNGKGGWYAFTGTEGLPTEDLTLVAAGPDGTVWLGSDQGLIRWRQGAWTYLASKRWLPDDRVTAIGPEADGSVWVGTPRGLAHITHRELTLEEKAAILQKDTESRPRRHGFVFQLLLKAAGVLEGARQEVSDNDGLWTGLYASAQAFRYAVTKAPEAHEQAWRSMQAMLRLESTTGISGFPARAMVHKDEPEYGGRSERSRPEWHPSPVEEGWEWKGETSTDELDGHFFAFYVYYELAATEEEKAQVRATCKRMMDHILDHGYYLVDIDGQPTTWGTFAPEVLNDDPKWWRGRGLNSLEILSHLKVTAHLVGDERYERAYRELIAKHHYALNAINAKNMPPSNISHDDQLAFLSYYPLLQLEKDPALRAIYIASLRRSWDPERVEDNPLWNFIYGASTGEPCDVEPAVASLREMPLDFVYWRMPNSHRADLKFDPDWATFGIERLRKPLPLTERAFSAWDSDPYELDSGSDMEEKDQTIWLLPYWMGRYHQIIE